MKPSSFPQSNVVFAKDQPEYLPLPAYRNDRETISRWQLTWRERLAVLLGGVIWLRQCNFGQPLQPQLPQVKTPFPPDREK
jgi:hypothetical protein